MKTQIILIFILFSSIPTALAATHAVNVMEAPLENRYSYDGANVNTENPEFSEWKWVKINTIVDNIVPFKRDVYSKILKEFKNLL